MKLSLSLVGFAAALLVASCSQQGPAFDPEEVAQDSSELARAPDISPTAAPGVAFRYDYDFRLADERIDDVQEAHAARCESLGVDRCRITGLRYSVNAQDQVYGMLQVKLDPTIAREFGKVAVAGVDQAGGRLINAEFTGEDEGSNIRRSTTRRNEIEQRIADIERRLDELPADADERIQLQQQLDSLRNEASTIRSTIAASEERLELTPMTLNYYGKGGVPGFGGRNPVEDAWRGFVGSGATMITVLLYVVGVLLPWAILLLLIVMMVRSRFGRGIRSWWSRSSYSNRPEE